MKLWETSDSLSSDKLVEQFTASEDVLLDEQLWAYDILGSLAHSEMLYQIGILSRPERDQVCVALSALMNEEVHVTPADEDIHTKLENMLVELIGDAGKKIHTARSRNDQVLVALRLYTKVWLLEIADLLLALAKECAQFAKRNEGQPMPGYTHTRAAMLSSVGLWASSLSECLLDDLDLLEAAYALVDQNPLGAAAGYGVPLAIDRELTTQLLGFARTQNNTLAVMNSRGKHEFAVLSALSCILLDLNRFASDLILFSAGEYGFFELPPEYCTGSSIMPHKRNPDVLELLRARSARVLSMLTQQAIILKGLTSGYHRDLQETKRPLFDALSTTHASLQILTPLIAGLRVNKKNLDSAITPELFAVDEVLERVQAGVALRDAYRQVKERLNQLKRRDSVKALKARSHAGGPGNLRLPELDQKIAFLQNLWSKRRQGFDEAQTRLLRLGT
ncbi:argininosuccinate lyase [Candidatus Acetothermia bacterium]|nr:argininosuccinate lyase [Candidatus Acetothermia bacterium]MBI3643934.1 argininosuccinate lyase [Candidatus Acetothermia bacterium]